MERIEPTEPKNLINYCGVLDVNSGNLKVYYCDDCKNALICDRRKNDITIRAVIVW